VVRQACAHRFVELGGRKHLFHPRFGWQKDCDWQMHFWSFFDPTHFLFFLDELLLRRSQGQEPPDLTEHAFTQARGWRTAHPQDRRCGEYPGQCPCEGAPGKRCLGPLLGLLPYLSIASKQGPAHSTSRDGAFLLLHLRELELVRLDLAHRNASGLSAAQMRSSGGEERLSDALLLAQLMDAAEVPHEAANLDATAGGGDAARRPRAALLGELMAWDGDGLTRELMDKTIASGSANPFVAAIELVRMTRRTHRAADARATAESVMSTAFDACPSPNAVAALLHEVRMPHPQACGARRPAVDDACRRRAPPLS